MAASSATAYFRGRKTNMSYIQSIYLDDTAGNPIRFGIGGKATATSPTSVKFNEPVDLVDFCIAAATGQTTTALFRNNVATGDYITNALHLASVTFRPALRVYFPALIDIQMTQLA